MDLLLLWFGMGEVTHINNSFFNSITATLNGPSANATTLRNMGK